MERKRSQWSSAVVQGAVILGSILLAFGIEAWWDTRQDALHRAALLEDLEAEIALNRDALESNLERQRLRVQRLELLLGELTPEAAGLGVDSVRALQAQVRNNPTWDPGFGILNLLIQSGDLALFEDRVLRARLAGLDAVSDDYLSNQQIMIELFIHPDVVFGTGSIVFDHSAFLTDDLTLNTASAQVLETAAKYFSVTLGVTNLLISQGETLLAELSAILALLQGS